MYDYQGMVILAANQVWWTWEVEDVFRKVKKGDKMGMKNYSKKLHSQIDDLVVQVGSIIRTCMYVYTFIVARVCHQEHLICAPCVCFAINCVFSPVHVKVRSQLSKNDRKKFNSVLIVEVHNRDIIDGFVRDR